MPGTAGHPVTTAAQRVWQECERSKARADPSWSPRDVIIHAVESFAEHWDLEFGFRIHDPNDVKEMARWIGQHLEAAGKVPPRISRLGCTTELCTGGQQV